MLTFTNIHLTPWSVNSLLHFFGIPLRLKKGLIKKVTAKGMNLSNLLALNVDSSFSVEGIYVCFESDGPIMQQPAAQSTQSSAKAARAGYQMKQIGSSATPKER